MENAALEYLMQKPLLNIGMREAVRRGSADILRARPDGVLLRERKSGAFMLSAENPLAGEGLVEALGECDLMVAHQAFMLPHLKSRFGLTEGLECLQAAYMRRERLPMAGSLEIKPLEPGQIGAVLAHYGRLSEDELLSVISGGALFGGYENGGLAGFIGIHLEGSMGMLEIFPQYRRRGYGEELERFLANHILDRGGTPYGHVFTDNEKSLALQRKLGFEICGEKIFWLF